ncbi:DMT family transporter [Collinsella tanakaei]|uniref:DMT family transporter n=1 Tax=Collinsella tanakaei TaxID=626935 RepID=UPI0022E47FAB|nr:DMT family transporter [Collinsella tanakaei]
MKASRGYAMVLCAALMWGSIGIFVNSLAAMGLSSVSIAGLRLLSGAILLMPVLMVMGARGVRTPAGEKRSAFSLFKAMPRTLLACFLVGVVGLAMANLFYYISMGEVGMSTASVLLYTSPVFGVALGKILYGEAVTGAKLLSVLLNITGCVLAVTNGDLTEVTFSVLGVGSGILAGFLGALLAVFSKMATERMHPLAVTFYGFVFGGLVMGVLSFPWIDVRAAVSPQMIGLLLAFGLIPTALAYIFYMNGLSMGVEASKVPVVASFETVATVLVGILLYAEDSGPIKVLGICLVLLSIFVMNMSAEKLRQSSLAAHLAEAICFNGHEWRQEKMADYNALANSGDWQTWIAPR